MTDYDFIKKARKLCTATFVAGGITLIVLGVASQIYEQKYDRKREESIRLYYRNPQKMEETRRESRRYMHISDLLLLGAAASALVSFGGYIGKNSLENKLRNQD